MMGGMGLIMLLGLIILTAVVIIIARSNGSFEPKSKRKNDELLRNDETHLISDDGEIVEYADEKATQRI